MKDKTHIVYIIDRSGSMSGRETDVIGGFNKFIKEQKEHSGEASMILVQFDNEYGPVSMWNNIQDAPELDNTSYVPRGMTALLDAVGRTINFQGDFLSSLPENDRPDKVVVLIMTDGMENDSKEFTSDQVKKMISHQRENYQWKFIFLGANQDSFETASGLGIPQAMTSNYDNTSEGVGRAYASASILTQSIRSTGKGSFDKIGRPSKRR
jgi:uncharacterized protein YegL